MMKETLKLKINKYVTQFESQRKKEMKLIAKKGMIEPTDRWTARQIETEKQTRACQKETQTDRWTD